MSLIQMALKRKLEEQAQPAPRTEEPPLLPPPVPPAASAAVPPPPAAAAPKALSLSRNEALPPPPIPSPRAHPARARGHGKMWMTIVSMLLLLTALVLLAGVLMKKAFTKKMAADLKAEQELLAATRTPKEPSAGGTTPLLPIPPVKPLAKTRETLRNLPPRTDEPFEDVAPTAPPSREPAVLHPPAVAGPPPATAPAPVPKPVAAPQTPVSPAVSTTTEAAPVRPWPALKVTALMAMGGRGTVRINERMLTVGDSVEGVRVVKIDARGVTLVWGGQTNVLSSGQSLP